MSRTPIIAVLHGGVSAEREVSLVSGIAVYEALEGAFPGRVQLYDLEKPELPDALDPATHVVFPVLHGTFGEDGGLQSLLDRAGFAYGGSGTEASRFCMDKAAVREVAASRGLPVPPGACHTLPPLPPVDTIVSVTGGDTVIKPRSQGSSIDVHFAAGAPALASTMAGLAAGDWIFEQRVIGREATVGVLGGRAMGVVEIVPGDGFYDYEHKYTSGMTEYRFPADFPQPVVEALRSAAELLFELCGCRDFARADFIVRENGDYRILEINTIPGLTPTSLLPKSAACIGLDFPGLIHRMAEPSFRRFSELITNPV